MDTPTTPADQVPTTTTLAAPVSTTTVDPVSTAPPAPKHETIKLTLAEWNLIKQIRSTKKPSLFWLKVGGDGAPKRIIAVVEIQEQILAERGG